MKANISNIDKTVRLLLAFIIAMLYLSGMLPGTAAIVMGVVFLILVGTSFLNFCPLYRILGVNTRDKKPAA